MAKTLGSVLQFASIAGLAYITGGVALGVAGGASLGSAVSGIAGSLGLSSGALALVTATTAARVFGAGIGKAPPAETTKTPLKTERPPRISGYGRARSTGTFIE